MPLLVVYPTTQLIRECNQYISNAAVTDDSSELCALLNGHDFHLDFGQERDVKIWMISMSYAMLLMDSALSYIIIDGNVLRRFNLIIVEESISGYFNYVCYRKKYF